MTDTQAGEAIVMVMTATGEAEVIRGPLRRIADLCAEIEAEGLEVPPEILCVLDDLMNRSC